MKLLGDLQKLVDEAAEAQRILGKKSELEREIAMQERTLKRLEATKAQLDGEIAADEKKTIEVKAHYEYERNRLKNDLITFQRQCDDAKRVSEKALHDQQAAARIALESYQAQHAGERKKLENEVVAMRSEKAAMEKFMQEFRQRVGAL